jgi:hypothetical protein
MLTFQFEYSTIINLIKSTLIFCVILHSGCYTSSDDSHSMERHYGSIRRSARKDKVQKVAAAVAKGSSALTSSLMHSSAPVLRPLFFEVR